MCVDRIGKGCEVFTAGLAVDPFKCRLAVAGDEDAVGKWQDVGESFH